ncbi:hypothetical protein [Vibrio splendidus]|uniref:hypothetical protein n=1 Tax=Vibrio splendidus TaxID=29497 RepID=UPI000C842674|nr:hypothetical protein [Vibrio splendidus]PMK13942.1 hypothetical protein BCU10_17240 [Vibrio splendidus]
MQINTNLRSISLESTGYNTREGSKSGEFKKMFEAETDRNRDLESAQSSAYQDTIKIVPETHQYSMSQMTAEGIDGEAPKHFEFRDTEEEDEPLIKAVETSEGSSGRDEHRQNANSQQTLEIASEISQKAAESKVKKT